MLADIGWLDIESDFYLKFAATLPAVLAHLIFIRLIFDAARRFEVTGVHYKVILLLAALNPAIVLNGPVWGQIDMLPSLLAVAALYLAIIKSRSLWIFPLYVLSIATKFQMICFAPVFAVFFFSDPRRALPGCLLALAATLAAFLPFIISGS